MLNLLIVDDEIPFLRNLSDYLGSFKDEFAVLAESTGEKALEIIKSDQPVDVLLSDIRLPGIDGIELVRQSMILRPSLKVLVMTAYPSRKIRTSATSAGALRYMEKPLDLGELHKVLLEAGQSSTGWSGSVGGLDLFDFTQLFTMSGKNTVLEVSYSGQKGVLVFKGGSLLHASTGDLEGDTAFHFMATWQGGTFNELSRDHAGEYPQNITTSANKLLMEAARLRDEAANAEANTDVFPLTTSENNSVKLDEIIEEEPSGSSTKRKENKKMNEVRKGKGQIIHDQLEALLGSSGEINGAIVIGYDGLVLASNLPLGGHEGARVGAAGAALFGLSKKTLSTLKCGGFEATILQGEEGWVIGVGAGTKAVVLGLTPAGINFGMALMEMRDLAEAVGGVMG